MHDVELKDLLECVGEKTEIHLSHRENTDQDWTKTVGRRADDEILRWIHCIVVAFKWEKDKPVQIAVEGVPYVRSNTN